MKISSSNLGSGIGMSGRSFSKLLVAIFRFFFGTPFVAYIWVVLILIIIAIGLLGPFGCIDSKLG